MPIIKLSDDLINKIAAGEVVERPASVVKELVENALDAKATHVIVVVKQGGQELINVSDNGTGMNAVDAKLCLERHTTSKIKSTLDLFKIGTLGFRGEALASIAAVSRLIVATKDAASDVGLRLETQAGNTVDEKLLAMPQGTTIEVCDLFFNVPARKKHLKSTATELKNIVDIVTHYALLYPQVSFKLLHDKSVLFDVPQTNDLLQRIGGIYGASLTKELLAVKYTQGDLVIEGYIAKPAAARNDTSMQHIAINGRWIKNEVIIRAIYDACHTVLFLEKHPAVVLLITLDPHAVDVNVHPTKTTVRLDKEQDVYQAVYEAVKDVLYNQVLVPHVILQEKKRDELSQSQLKLRTIHQTIPLFEKEFQQQIGRQIPPQLSLPENQQEEQEKQKEPMLTKTVKQMPVLSPTPPQAPPKLRILGRIKETFIIAENDQGMLLIDQHAMHERIMYERFMNQFYNNSIQKQELLTPQHVELTPSEQVTLNANKEILARLGFAVEGFGHNSFVIRTWPSIYGRMQKKELLYDLLAELNEKPLSTDEIKEERLIRRSCRSAVKAHDTLELPEMYRMIEDLHQCKMPYTCPHGRPTMIQFTQYELEKKFKRVH